MPPDPQGNEGLLRDALDSVGVQLAVLDAEGGLLAVNAAWRREASDNGGTASCLPGVNYLAACRASLERGFEDARAPLEGISAVLAGSAEHFSWSYACDTPQKERWFSMSVYPLRGERPGAVVVHEDVTEAKRNELKRVESEARFRQLFETTASAFLLVDPKDGAIVDCNEAAVRFSNVSREALLARTIGQFNQVPAAQLGAMLERAATEGGTTFLFPLHGVPGGPRTVEAHTTPVVSDGRTLIFTILEDVTLRERAQEAVERERERYRTLMTLAHDGIHLLDERGLLVEANEAFLRSIGHGPEAVGRLTVSDWDPELPPAEAPRLLAELVARPRLLERQHRRADGTCLDVEVTASGVELDGRSYVLGISRDVTVRRALERALMAEQAKLEEFNHSLEARVWASVSELRAKDELLVHQSRRAAMGEMIGNIAHQWRQPLNALALVLGNLADAQAAGELDAPTLNREVQTGQALVQKMSATINDFRDFFRPDKGQVPFSARAQLEHTVGLVRDAFRHGGVEIRLLPGEAQLVGLPNEFSQVVLNLLANAKDAIQARGVRGGWVEVGVTSRGREGLITVRDNGGGIEPEVLGRIFDPYFTTRPGGTGIGLSMSKLIVERSLGGRVSARNVEGGALLELSCPLAEGAP